MEKDINTKELIKKLINASNIIHQQSLKCPGNFMVVSPEVAESIKMLDIKYQRRKKLDKINKSKWK